jgi:signal peptidase I
VTAVLRTGSWAAIAFCTTVLAVVALPGTIGWHSFTVMSGSMEPSIHTGDVVIDQKIRPPDARPGDVVTFSDPANPHRLITHRVRSLRVHGSVAQVVTKGDANNTTEHWTVPARGTIGRVELRVPHLGYPLVYAHSRPGLIALVAVPALLLCMLELRSIWMPREEPSRA